MWFSITSKVFGIAIVFGHFLHSLLEFWWICARTMRSDSYYVFICCFRLSWEIHQICGILQILKSCKISANTATVWACMFCRYLQWNASVYDIPQYSHSVDLLLFPAKIANSAVLHYFSPNQSIRSLMTTCIHVCISVVLCELVLSMVDVTGSTQ